MLTILLLASFEMVKSCIQPLWPLKCSSYQYIEYCGDLSYAYQKLARHLVSTFAPPPWLVSSHAILVQDKIKVVWIGHR